jgi:PilZ domain
VFTEQRRSPRKILKVKAMLAIDGAPPVAARTLDIGANGMCLAVANPVPVGQGAQVAFDLLLEGKPSPVNVRAKVSYCIFSSGEFKVGVQFLNLDLSSMTMLARFLR